MQKKLLAFLLAAACALSMTACGVSTGNGGAAPSGESTADTAAGDAETVGDAAEEEASGAVKAQVIDIDLTNEEYAFGVDKDQPELLEQVNAFVSRIKEDGTLDEICDRYFGDGEPVAVASAEFDESKDQLVVATNAAFEPFEYTQGDSYLGIDMEIASMLADELGLELVIQNMEFDAVCLSVGQHQCDIAMAGLTVNEEREAYVTFTESYYEASQRLIVPSTDTTFADCAEAADVEALLNELTDADSIGVQSGTTGQFYVEGNEEWGFPGLPATCVPYRNGSLAVQDMLNGNVKYVIIDAAPAEAITQAINALR